MKKQEYQKHFKKDIIKIMALAVAISILSILLFIPISYLTFNEKIKDLDLSGSHEYMWKAGLPLRFLTISITPPTNHFTIITYDYINSILNFIFYFVCLFILLYVILLILRKRKILKDR
jgi:hypothetical protein